ncbi:hypothetical protein H4S14_002226 [Agrobacterium vitis]|nr:hypothetical protein [Agrobacterium vitis]MBE1438479.1 hypothetical protein [Agrobacterium vitis]
MGEIRGEKVHFRKRDIVSLESLPSAQAEDILVVHCPRHRGLTRKCYRFLLWLLAILVVCLGVLTAAIETGTLDQALSTGARTALKSAFGERFTTEIGQTSIRFSKSWHLAVAAENVRIMDAASGKPVSETGVIKLIINPLELLVGRVSVTEIEADTIHFFSSPFRQDGQIDVSTFRIDQFPKIMETLFLNLDDVHGFIARGGLNRVRIGDISLTANDNIDRPVTVAVDDLIMTRREGDALAIQGQISIDGKTSHLAAETLSEQGRSVSLTATMSNLVATPLTMKFLPDGTRREGADLNLNIDLFARRDVPGGKPALAMRVRTQNGTIFLDGIQQELTQGDINIAYDFDRLTAEIRRSTFDFGPMHVPFNGGFVDLDRLKREPGDTVAGIGIDLLVDRGTASVPAAGEEMFPFSIKAFGRFVPSTRDLNFSELTVSTPNGQMHSTLNVRFGDKSPEIRFNGKLQEMRTAFVKQLWPYWMAWKPRVWVLANLFGGTVSNASIDVFIPAGRMTFIPTPLLLGPDELRVKFDIANARMNTTGNIPPIRDMIAHFDLEGPNMNVRIDGGTSYFPSGRKVSVDSGAFTVDDVYQKPLMANIDLSLSGAADAIAELSTFKPIEGLQRTEFVPADFNGQIKAHVQFFGGLLDEQNPPPPEWKADLQLKGVDLMRPYMDKKITSFDGDLVVDPQNAVLNGNGQIDGIPMDINLTQPVARDSRQAPSWTVKATLSDSQRSKVVPDLNGLIDGPMSLEISRLDEHRQTVKTDLTGASINLPWLGWSKGPGISAKTSMEISTRSGLTTIDNFNLTGDGFGAQGKILVSKTGLVSADFDHAKLASMDDFSVSLRTNKGVTSVKVNGTALDGRSLFKKLKSGGGANAPSSSDTTTKLDLDVSVALDKLAGFNNEALSGVKLLYGSRAGTLTALNMSGVTNSGQAIVVKSGKNASADEVSVITSDAGDVARLLDLYSHMRGGLLDLRIRGDLGKNWTGSLDLRNFKVENEEKLQKIVTTPATDDGRSLNSAVKQNIDVSSEKFQRAFARLIYKNGVLATENGIVRGEQVGASFQGIIKDARGNMEMTGTFMPAYGLNRLFAEVPIIGFILGNGRDRGLLGITFKLTGSVDSPHLIVNPLSIIAPGVFRQIFEF